MQMKHALHSAVIVIGTPSGKRGDWDEIKNVFSFFVNNSYRMLRFVKKALFSLV